FYSRVFRLRITDDGNRQRITRSARAKTFGGMMTPICFAVLRLITSSIFVGCATGRSAGLARLRILSTYVAARRNRSGKLAPQDIRHPSATNSLAAYIA